jgi:hypothetical protein
MLTSSSICLWCAGSCCVLLTGGTTATLLLPWLGIFFHGKSTAAPTLVQVHSNHHDTIPHWCMAISHDYVFRMSTHICTSVSLYFGNIVLTWAKLILCVTSQLNSNIVRKKGTYWIYASSQAWAFNHSHMPLSWSRDKTGRRMEGTVCISVILDTSNTLVKLSKSQANSA